MSWKITVGEKSILMDDLSEKDLVDACREYPETNWLKMYTSPGSSPGAMYELVKICAGRLMVATPPRPTNVKESIALLIECFDQVEDDLPTEFGNEGVPLGEVAETETTSSSTSTEPEDGPQT